MKLIYTMRADVDVREYAVRNPYYFEKIEAGAGEVLIEGDFPHIAEAYSGAGVAVSHADAPEGAKKATVAELRAALEAKGIEVPEGAKKADLQALLDSAG